MRRLLCLLLLLSLGRCEIRSALQGQSVALPCALTHHYLGRCLSSLSLCKGEFSIAWYNRNGVVSKCRDYNGRMRAILNETNYDVIIKDVRASDEDEYRCELRGQDVAILLKLIDLKVKSDDRALWSIALVGLAIAASLFSVAFVCVRFWPWRRPRRRRRSGKASAEGRHYASSSLYCREPHSASEPEYDDGYVDMAPWALAENATFSAPKDGGEQTAL